MSVQWLSPYPTSSRRKTSSINCSDEFDLMSIANNKKLNKDYLLAEDVIYLFTKGTPVQHQGYE